MKYLMLVVVAFVGVLGFAQSLSDDRGGAVASTSANATLPAPLEGAAPHESFVTPSEWMDRHGGPEGPATQSLAEPKHVTIESGALFLRAGPDIGADVLRVVKSGKRIVVLDKPGADWTRAIDPETGAFGWVSSRFFETPPPPAAAARRAAIPSKAAPIDVAPPIAEAVEEPQDDHWACPCR